MSIGCRFQSKDSSPTHCVAVVAHWWYLRFRSRLRVQIYVGLKRIYRIFEYSFVSKRIFVWIYTEFEWIFLTIFGSLWYFWGSNEIFRHKIDYYQLNYDWKLSILRLLMVTGNIYWLFQITFWQMKGVNAYSLKRTNIRIFVRLEKGSFVTFRIFVSALILCIDWWWGLIMHSVVNMVHRFVGIFGFMLKLHCPKFVH